MILQVLLCGGQILVPGMKCLFDYREMLRAKEREL